MTRLATTQAQILDDAARAVSRKPYAECDSFERALAQTLAGIEASEVRA